MLVTSIGLGPETNTCSLLKPGPLMSFPGSKNSELLILVPVIVTVEILHVGTVSNFGVDGAGAISCPALTPHDFMVSAY